MSYQFPARWKSAQLRSLTSKIGSGATPRGGKQAYKRSGVPLIRFMNVHFDGFHMKGLAYLDNQQAAALKGVTVQAGDVLLNITGASIGRVTQAPQDMHGARVNQHVCIIRPNDSIDPAFIARYLASPWMQDFVAGENYGVTRQALTKEMIENIAIPLPSPVEQKLILAKLNTFSRRTKTAREELANIPRLVERFNNTALESAFCGSLTNDDSSSWASMSLGDLINGIDAGKNVRCEERPPKPSERGIVKVSSVTWGSFDSLAAKTPDRKVALDLRTLIRQGDFLISRANTEQLVGACVIVGTLSDNNLYLSDKVLRVRFNQPVDTWVLNYLRSPSGRAQIEGLSTGNQLSMRNISQAAMRAIRLPLPPQDIRARILASLENIQRSISKAVVEAEKAGDLLDRLDQTILGRAFRGELVGCVESHD